MYGYPQYPQYANQYFQDPRQQYQQMQMQNPQPAQSQQPDERIWVQGRDAALAYLVAPNGFARLWDSSAPVFYEKHADATGRPLMEVYRYEKQTDEAPEKKIAEEYGERFKALEMRILALEKRGQRRREPANDKQSYADDSGISEI